MPALTATRYEETRVAPPTQGTTLRTLAIYMASRLLTFLAAWVAAMGWSDVLSRLTSWDGGWFLLVVHAGYPTEVPTAGGHVVQSTLPFFPLYPIATRAVAWVLPGSDAWAAVTVSLACGALGAVLIHRLVGLVSDAATADRAVVLYCLFPGSMVLSWGYSEALMVVLAVGCLIALRQQRWLLAGVLASAATATRATALVLVLVCAWEAFTAIRRHGAWRPLVAPVLAPTGMLAYFGYLWAHTGDALAFLHAEEAWGVGPGLGRTTFRLAVAAVRSPWESPMATIATASLVFAIVTAVLLLRRPWPPMLSIYSLGIVAFSVTSRVDGLRPRDVLTAFPLIVALAARVSDDWFRRIAWVFGVLLFVSTVLHGTGFWGQP